MKTTFWATVVFAALLSGVASAGEWSNGNVSVRWRGDGAPAVDVNGANYSVAYRRGPRVQVRVGPPPIVEYRYYEPPPYRRYRGDYYYNGRYWVYRRW